MTFSSELEQKFAKMLQAYPEGRKRSAVVPMLIYAQDEVGSITPELIDEVARRAGISRSLLFHYFATKREYYTAVTRAAADLLWAHLLPPPGTPSEQQVKTWSLSQRPMLSA